MDSCERNFFEQYNENLLDYESCKKIHEDLLARKAFIQNELNLTNDDSTIKKTIDSLESKVEEINGLVNESEKLAENIKTDLKEVEEVRSEVHNRVDKIHFTETAAQYLKVLQCIESYSIDLEKEFNGKDDENCATIFANLCDISRILSDCKVYNLRNYLKETLVYWHNVLKDKLSKDFDELLKHIKWPFINQNVTATAPTPTHIYKLQIVVEYLLQIELPDESLTPIITSALLSDFPPLSLAIHYLIEPLRKRFLYHFYGGRQTNRIDKPEWYFTHILKWIKDHVDFVGTVVQPIVDKLGLHHIDAKLEFMRGLVQLSVEKLNSDLPNLQFDDYTFSHCVDEALGFDKELREVYSYPPSQPSVLSVLTQAKVFDKWLKMEKKYAIEKMDILLSPNADAFQPALSEEDEFKKTQCADTFITLLQTITERYELLHQPGHRLQFLDLQLELLDDFRIRLLQLVNAEEGDIIESRIPMIANTIFYVENVLCDWGSTLHYLSLMYYSSKLNNMENSGAGDNIRDVDFNDDLEEETVFTGTLSLYKHMRKDLLATLSESVVREAKLRSRGYLRERWSTMTHNKDARTLSLTPSACPMFEILSRRLHQLQKSLASKLFTIVWRYIAQELDTYLFEELLLENRFSESGASQLKYDITRNLFPLFFQFSEKPENHFVQLKESCELLNISKGSALLLRETLLALEGATGVEDTRGRALKEIGVANFSPQMSVQILNQRTDITVNRLTID